MLTFLQKMEFERGCILLKDVPAEKAGTWAGGIVKRVTAVNALKGELLITIPGDKLIPRNDGKRPNNYRLVKDETITVYADAETDIAPLNDHEFLLMAAIESPLARYEAFISDKLEWGVGLKPGDAVYVTVQGNVRVSAIIRCVVDVTKQSGLLFGVEIMVRTYHIAGNFARENFCQTQLQSITENICPWADLFSRMPPSYDFI